MPLSGVSVNNPQEQLDEIQPTTVGATVTFAGNAIGGNAGSASAAPSSILVYGIIGLIAVFILQRLDK